MEISSSIEDICGRLSRDAISRAAFVEECVRLTCRQIGCNRGGLWIAIESDRGRLLRCLGMFDSVKNQMRRVPDESEERSGPYFLALDEFGHVLAPDARSHPATRSFFVGRPDGAGVRSLMAAAFSLNGKLYGALTCTQIGEPMTWTLQQLTMLRQIGARATLALAGASPHQLDSLWSALA